VGTVNRTPLPTMGGVHVSAERRARDRAYGAAGLLWIFIGIVLQALPYLGVSQSRDASLARLAAVVTLGVATLLAAFTISAVRRRFQARIEAGEQQQAAGER
jgi:hypothetical protein